MNPMLQNLLLLCLLTVFGLLTFTFYTQTQSAFQQASVDLALERASLNQERENLQAEREFIKQKIEQLLRFTMKPKPINEHKAEVAVQVTPALKPFMTHNRETLTKVPRWIEDSTLQGSYFHYGVPDHVRALLDKDIGFEPTYSDVMSFLGNTFFMGPKTYLEIGISVGKNMFQMLNAFENSDLYAYELESINPTLENLVENKNVIDSWKTMENSARKADSSLTEYDYPLKDNKFYYTASDVFDEKSWTRLATQGQQYDIIFSDGLHSGAALLEEIDRLLALNLINPDRFIIWYDDLGGDMTVAFYQIAKRLQEKFAWLGDDNVALVKVGGWFGVNEFKHLNGIITSLNITKIIAANMV